MRLLLVEDSFALGEAVAEQLREEGQAVDWMQNLAQAKISLATTSYDLILLDLLLPDGKGIDFLKALRDSGKRTPVIILTALDQLSDRIRGLNAGADDYLVKPFDLAELSARIAAVIRRYNGNPNPVIHLKDLVIDQVRHSIFRGETLISLTAKEWAIFEILLCHAGSLLSRTQMEDHLYAFGTEIESNSIEVHISRLRKKLGRDLIETVRGMGYRLVKA